jgi:hypothetical protein
MSPLGLLQNADTCFDLELHLTECMCEAINTPHSLAIYIAIRNHEWIELKSLEPNPSHYMDQSWTDFTAKIFLSERIFICSPPDVSKNLDSNVEIKPLSWFNPQWSESKNANLWRNDPQAFRWDRQVSRMLVKSKEIPTGIDTETEALDLFKEIEGILAEREATFNLFHREEMAEFHEPWVLELSREVNSILSEDGSYFLTRDVLDRIVQNGQCGPGASVGVPRNSVLSEKLRSKTSVSPQLAPFLHTIKYGAWETEQPKSEVASIVQVSTVPKTAYVDRTVSAVQTANMYMQLGLARELERILLDVGVNIRDQGKNQNLAKRACNEMLATIDLASASSWFSQRNMVGIFPPDLMHLLDLIRPHVYSCRTKEYCELPKYMYNYMPMGCGYTFALMTLYFWALVRITVPKSALSVCSVYGDDIIVPQKYAKTVVDRLEVLGFKVNSAKSFLKGSFFESCGTEWFNGHDVRPFYCRRGTVSDDPNENGVAIPYRIQLANRLRLWLIAGDKEGRCDMRFKGIWMALIKKVPLNERPEIPFTLGDVGLAVSLSETHQRPYEEGQRRGWCSTLYRIPTLVKDTVDLDSKDPFPYLMWLMNRMKYDSADPPRFSSGFLNLLQGQGYDMYGLRTCIYQKGANLIFGTIKDALRDVLIHGDMDKPDSLFSKGSEPLRGLFGKPHTKRVVVRWLSGGDWYRTR